MARRKNRKKDSEGFIFPAPIAFVLGVATVIALAHLWLGTRCNAVGSRIKFLEERKAEVRKQVVNEEYKWSNMKTPENIKALLQHFNLEMAWPEKGRVVRVKAGQEEARAVEIRENARQYAHFRGVARND